MKRPASGSSRREALRCCDAGPYRQATGPAATHAPHAPIRTVRRRLLALATVHVPSHESPCRLTDTMPLRSHRAIFEAENRREASVITFLATASGMTWLGIGSVAYKVLNRVRRPA